MLTEIDKDFYCSANSYREDNKCLVDMCAPSQMCHKFCYCYHRKYPTPEQFKEEYGFEPTKDMPVWVLVRGVWKVYDKNGKLIPDEYSWNLDQFGGYEKNNDRWNNTSNNINANFIDRYVEAVVIACTPFGMPPADWRPE